MKKLNSRQVAIKERFTKERGYWSDLYADLLEIDDPFLEAYLNFSAKPWNKGVLDPKTKEFIYIAIDVATTHIYEPGIKVHTENALNYGATREEILEVMKLATILGVDTCKVGAPILMDELKKNGNIAVIDEDLTKSQQQLKDMFIDIHGYWSEALEDILVLDEDYFQVYLDLSADPWRRGVLEPKVRELVYLSIASSCTHLNEQGIRIHIQNALKHGATKEEIMEVFELTSVLGIHAITSGLPILVDLLKK